MSNVPVVTAPAAKVKEHKLSLKEKVSYGFGDFGNGFMFDLGQIYLLKFFTDVAGIPATVRRQYFLVSKLFAALTDPIVGSAIDYRKRSDPGEIQAVLIIRKYYSCGHDRIDFCVTGRERHLEACVRLCFLHAVGVAYSFVNIPYGSLGAAITQDAEDRTALSAFRQIGSLGAPLITSVIVIPILVHFDNVHIGYPAVMGMMAVIGIAGFMICYRNCKERIIVREAPKEKLSVMSVFKCFIGNKPLLTVVFMTIFSISAYNIKSAMLVYFAQYNLNNAELMSYMSFIIIGSSFLGVLFMPKLVKRFGKKQTVMIGFAVSAAADALNFCLPSNVFIFTALASIAFIGISIPNGITWALVSDIIDYGEWKTGERKEATTYSLFNFSRKLAQSLSGFLSGIGLSVIGYIPNASQTKGTLIGIKGLLLAVPGFRFSVRHADYRFNV